MDNFIDKLAQKFSAQEVIKANLAAEAKETRRLREKMESYETLLTEMRQINLKNMESAEKVKQLMQEGIAGDKDYFQEQFDKLNETLHTENVKVYRNVQAAINESLEGQTKQLLEEQQKLIEEQHEAKVKAEKEKTRGNLLRAISHDLRTPLTAISGAAAVIKESDAKMTKEEKNFLHSDRQWECRRGAEMICVI